MATGRRPKPTELKRLQGNLGKRRLNEDEPVPISKIGKPPSWLSRDAKAEWRRVIPELQRLKLVTGLDSTALSSYCQAYGRWVEAEKYITAHGLVVEQPLFSKHTETVIGHKLVKNPACIQALSAQKEMRALLGLFGLSPSDRSRLKSGAGEEKLSPLAELLKSRQKQRQPEQPQEPLKDPEPETPPSDAITIQ